MYSVIISRTEAFEACFRFLHVMMWCDETDEAFALVKVKYNLSLVLKKEQFEVIDSLLHGRNVIAILPTGFGKSLMFVLPPLLLDEVCVLYEIVSFVFTRNAWARADNG